MPDTVTRFGPIWLIATLLRPLREALASASWLATNRYATGKVGAVGIGWGAGLLGQMLTAPDPQLACGVSFGDADASGSVPLLRLPVLAASTDPATYAASWQQAIGFLAGNLRPAKR